MVYYVYIRDVSGAPRSEPPRANRAKVHAGMQCFRALLHECNDLMSEQRMTRHDLRPARASLHLAAALTEGHWKAEVDVLPS